MTLSRDTLKRWAAAMLFPRPLMGLRYLPAFFKDWRRFEALSGRGSIKFKDSYPCLSDRVANTPFDPHYFYQSAWLMRCLAKDVPTLHVDVASSVMAMGVVSGLVPTIFVDYRPLKSNLSGLTSVAANMVRMPFRSASVES